MASSSIANFPVASSSSSSSSSLSSSFCTTTASPSLSQVQLLLEQKQWKSAEFLASVAVSSLCLKMKLDSSPSIRFRVVETVCLHSDALIGDGEIKRALAGYSTALSVLKMISSGKPASFTFSASSPSSSSSSSSPITENSIRLKMAEGYLVLNDYQSALNQLEAIDVSNNNNNVIINNTAVNNFQLTVAMHKASCYKRRGSKEAAVEQYKLALQINPFCTEAITGFLENSHSPSDLTAILKRVLPQQQPEWFFNWLEMLKARNSCDFPVVLQWNQILREAFGYNTHFVLDAADAHFRLSNYSESAMCFEKVVTEDPYCTDRMDIYASMLRKTASVQNLNKLSHTLLSANSSVPEPWISLALLADKKGKRDVAHKFVDKAIEISSGLHYRSYVLKGALSNTERKFTSSIKAFKKAGQLSKDLVVFQGLIESYLYNSQSQEAMLCAQDALSYFPNNASAHTLLGNVLFSANSWQKARKEYEKALSINPDCIEAIISLVDLDCSENKVTDAIFRLKKCVSKHKTLHTKLANLYAKSNDFAEASFHYNAALNANQHDEHAQSGLKKICRVMNGLQTVPNDAAAVTNTLQHGLLFPDEVVGSSGGGNYSIGSSRSARSIEDDLILD